MLKIKINVRKEVYTIVVIRNFSHEHCHLYNM